MNLHQNRLFYGLIFLIIYGLNAFAQDTKSLSSVPNVPYCDLIVKPLNYDKKVIRTQVIYVVGFESAAMYDDACKEAESIWVEFDSGLKDITDITLWKKFEKLTDPKNDIHQNRYAKVTWIGLFHANNEIDLGNGMGYELPYGFKYYFTAQKIEAVEDYEKKSELRFSST